MVGRYTVGYADETIYSLEFGDLNSVSKLFFTTYDHMDSPKPENTSFQPFNREILSTQQIFKL